MTGRVSRSGSSRWSRSVASPTTSVTNHAPKTTNGERIAGREPERQQPERERPDQRRRRGPPVDRPTRRVLLVMLRPARREAVGRQAEGEARRPPATADSGSIGGRRRDGGAALGSRAGRRRSAGPGAGEGQLHERRVRGAGRAARGVRVALR